MSYWKSQHFLALQKAWYAKLEASGFEDAESFVKGELVLKQSAMHPLRDFKAKRHPDEYPTGLPRAWACQRIIAHSEYYQAICSRIEDGAQFKSEADRIILTMHAEGARVKTIIEALSKAGVKKCRMTVRTTIRKYLMAWGLKSYTEKQLNRYPTRSA